MKAKRKFSKRMLSFFLCFAMLLTYLPAALSAQAAVGYTGGAGQKVSDADTSSKYTESLGNNASTEFAGRIWTDKSVYTDDVTFDVYGGGRSTILLNEKNSGEDFLVAYSALATAESVLSSTQAPADVVLVIDISGSMSNGDSNMDNGSSRIYNTVQAANDMIDELMALNEYMRVAVVAFSNTAEVLLPLDRYTKTTERVWVGNIIGGHYEDTEVPYFTLNRSTGSPNNATLYTKAVSSANKTISKSTAVEGATNIQMGLYTGMKILADEKSTKANINGSSVQRKPSVILLSDGCPTKTSNSKEWWAPSNNDRDGHGEGAYAGNGMMAILTGSYMKDVVDRNYGVTDTAFKTTLYTIGVGISSLPTDKKNLANITLDPGTYWDDDTTNSMKTEIKKYWSEYTAGNNTGTIKVNVGYQPSSGVYRDDYRNVIHPTTDYDVDPTDGYNYVDRYYSVENAATVTSVFEAIVSSILISAPRVPTEIKGEDPMSDGYITYTDPIGEYMEVKDVKAVIYAGITFTVKSVVTSGNTTTYTFTGAVESPVYGNQQISNILISVTETAGKQTLVVKIPASVIPLRVNEVMLNSDGSVKTHTNNGAMPTRVIYSVGLQSEVTKQADNGTVYIDKSKLSSAYLAANTNADGTINFYSNEYTNPHLINGSTVGDATVEFEPAHTNKFYYISEDTPIYKDEQLTVQLTASEGIKDNSVYYYGIKYYFGATVQTEAIRRTGVQLKNTEIKTGDDGCLYRAVGSPRVNTVLNFEGTKVNNITGTAQDFYAPEFHYADDSHSAYDGRFIVHLGNNGRLSVAAGGTLQISKTVNAASGLTAPDKTFVFTIDLDGAEVNGGTYNYVITDASGQVSSGTVSASNTTVSLKGGQTATIYGLPPETEYVVTEAAEAGFTTRSSGASGTITAGNTSVASFTNTYSATPVSWPTNGDLEGTKELVGRAWDSDDSFTFFITPYNNAPLPEGYNAAVGVTVSAPDEEDGNTASFDFGTIKFTAPGVYRYTIVEKEPENVAYRLGMSYSRAEYRVVVTVVDNGNGTLSVTDSDVQRLYNDAAEPLFSYDQNNQIVMNEGGEGQDSIKFINSYNATSVTCTPVAVKSYTDNSGQNPLTSGMFNFELKALGIVENGNVTANTASRVPMPKGSTDNKIVTSNEGRNVTFPSITFSQADIPEGQSSITFRYQMSELVGATPVNGMTYDSNRYNIDVIVSIDANSSSLSVQSIYPNEERVITFVNEYTPKPVSTDINGNKTLIGRDMKSGESFEFTLGCDTATAAAVNSGIVTIPSSSATVSGGKNGVAKAFAFKNIVFKKAGTYVFTVSETAGSAPSVRYDNSSVTVTVVIDDSDRDGNLEVTSVTYGNGKATAEFTNTYTSRFNGNPISLKGTKKLTGKSLLAGEFYFDIVEYYNGNETARRAVSHTAGSTPSGGVYSGEITILDNVTYDKAGTYEYVITEQIPENKVKGTTYDTAAYRYTVVVEDDLNGNLAVTRTSLKRTKGNNSSDVNAVEFSNSYVPEPTTATLPTVSKVIDGDRSDNLKAGEFDFELKVTSANPADGIALPANTVVSNDKDGYVKFGAITFTKAGSYTVTVTEVIPADADKVAGITYSTQVITAVYKVVDDRNGKLTATLERFSGTTITNTYKATPADASIEISKSFTGRKNNEWLNSDRFDFKVKVTDTDTLAAIRSGDVEFTLDSENTATYSITSKGAKATADIKIKKPGTYKFVVSEVDGGIKGVTYDKSEKEVIIVATDDSANAKIDVKINGVATDKASVSFENKYEPAATAAVAFTAKKRVTPSDGNSFTLKGGEFEFVISGSHGAPMPSETTAQNDANGNVSFGSVSFTERGTYSYTVREVQSNLGGFTYDGSVYNVTVSVTDDYANGKLVATASVTDGSGKKADIVFDNKYNPKATSAIIFGAKELNGGHKTLAANEFSFELKAVTKGAPMPSETVVKNTAAGAFQFGAISYTKVGTYKYEISEINLGKHGYTYDTTVYPVTVTVTDEGKGVLNAKVEGLGSAEAPAVKFVNSYTPDPVEVELGAEGELAKRLEGRELTADEFVFALLDSDGKELATGKNSANGTFKLALRFTEAGTYNYTLVEKNNEVAGVTYDVKSYAVKIVISDKDGHLKASEVTYSLDGENVENVVFNNTYKAEKTDVTISATKNLIGRELVDGEFKFVLKDKDGKLIATATNSKDGKIVFDKLVITEAGSYTYTVYEELGTLENVIYDKTEYTVELKVTDDGKGKLVVADPIIKKSGADGKAEGIVFENTYTVPTPDPTPTPTPEYPQTPKTGDSTNLALWFALLFVSGGGLAGATVYGKKKSSEKN